MTNAINTAAAPAAQAPTIATSAVLVELGISTWTARKKDRRASADVTVRSRAATGMASVNKKLLDCDELTAVQKFAANARNAHYAMTLPWSDSGLRMLPTAQYFKYNEAMTALHNEFNDLVDAFLDKYEWEINTVQVKLGDLFDPNEYPTVRDKFSMRLNYIPLPEVGDFRVDIGNQAADEMRAHYEKFYSAQLERAMSDVWSRAYEVLERMSERLDYADHEQKKVFRDSLVQNVVDLIDLLETMNITNDANMQLQQRRLKAAIEGITPDALRADGHLRSETKKAVDDVIASLPSLDL